MKKTAFFLATAFILATGSAFVTNSNSKLNTTVLYLDGTSTCQGPVTISDECTANGATPCRYLDLYNVFENNSTSTCGTQLFKN
jgi:hypothetical protein